MSYDQGYWHTDTCSELGVPEENAATHIAVYLRWCIDRCLLSDDLEKEDSEQLNLVRTGQVSAAEYFERYLDWKLGESDLNESGNLFTKIYYKRYLADISAHFPEVVYGQWSDVDYPKLANFLDMKYSDLTAGSSNSSPSAVEKPWWKLW